MKAVVEINGLKFLCLVTSSLYRARRRGKIKGKEYQWEEIRINTYIPKDLRAEKYVIIPVIEPYIKIKDLSEAGDALRPTVVAKEKES